jgi:hypothetical protein
VNGQSEEKIVLIEENIDYAGPFWYSVSCLKISCPGLSIEINDLENHTIENEHFLEWSGILNTGSRLTVSSETGTSIDDISIQMVKVNQLSVIEEGDLIDSIPSPGNQDDYYTIITEDICTLGNCDSGIEDYQRKLEFVGILDNYSDKDSIRIAGNSGDIIEVSEMDGDGHLRIEVWQRNNQEKKLLSNDLQNSGSHFIEYPETG